MVGDRRNNKRAGMASKASSGKLKFWKSDWFIASVPALAVALFAQGAGIQSAVENRVYDSAVSNPSVKPSEEVVLLTIDTASLDSIGRWPWPRQKQAELITAIAAAKPKVIAPTIFYMEPQTEAGLPYIAKMKAALAADVAASPATQEALRVAAEAEIALDGDATLAAAIKAAGNVVLPTPSNLGLPTKRPETPISGGVIKSFLDAKDAPGVPLQNLPLVYAPVGDQAARIAPIGLGVDASSSVQRAEPTLYDFFGQPVLPYAMAVVAAHKGLSNADIRYGTSSAGNAVLLIGNLSVPISDSQDDTNGTHRPIFYARSEDKPAIPSISAIDLLSGKVAPGRLAGKIVVVGTDVAGVANSISTPAGTQFSSEFVANAVSAALQGHYVSAGGLWTLTAGILASALVLGYLVFLLPRLSAGTTNVIAAVGVLALLFVPFILLRFGFIWVQLFFPAILLLAGHLIATSKRFFVTEQGKAASDAESAETNRMMGLALAGQGRLDEAFDRYRRVPLNEQHGVGAMENMYALALDFERKRQFNKAQAVYEYMHAYDPKFKDLDAKLRRAKNLSETVILGGGGSHPGGTMILGDGSVEKPKLGRYDVDKELGKGAMGVVYLGKDPKIGRVVAIKTMALSNEFEGEELVDARERFFREAETAGRLQHQNIVTIFDAGEEHDLAYIAMEFLKGKDLVDYSKDGNLLPVPRVLSIVARVAEALAYAHKQNVVHRDIKPANIMYEHESDTVKVTDFGIARITDSSKTKTGLVLGTPSFMSPEQIAGKRVDGRSDLYSLGVMLFQMLTGVLPFRGDSMAELMYKIANEDAPNILLVRGQLPQQLAEIVALSLSKRPEVRYQDGEQMAIDLRAVMALIQSGAEPDSPKMGGAQSPSQFSAATAAFGAATVTTKAQAVSPADEKTQVLGVTGANEKTAVFTRPDVTESPLSDNSAYDKTQLMPFGEAPGATETAPYDPFEKTIVSRPSGNAGGNS